MTGFLAALGAMLLTLTATVLVAFTFAGSFLLSLDPELALVVGLVLTVPAIVAFWVTYAVVEG